MKDNYTRGSYYYFLTVEQVWTMLGRQQWLIDNAGYKEDEGQVEMVAKGLEIDKKISCNHT